MVYEKRETARWMIVRLKDGSFVIHIKSGSICDCLSENRPSSHLPVFREIPF